jgi:hypothetical protein
MRRAEPLREFSLVVAVLVFGAWVLLIGGVGLAIIIRGLAELWS